MGMHSRTARARGARVRSVISVALAVVVALGLCSTPIRAADETLEAGLDRCRALVENEDWERAEAAMRALLVAHEGNKMAFGYIEEIEETLRLCMFRQAHGLPEPDQIFGGGVKRFDRRSRTVTLEFDRPSGPLWQSENDVHLYMARFEGSFTVTLQTSGNELVGALLCYDIENKGGYLATAGQLGGNAGSYVPARLLRLDGDSGAEALDTGGPAGRGSATELEVKRQGSQLTVKRDGRSILKARDDTYTSGYHGVFGDGRSIEMKGRADRHWLRSRTGDLLAANYAEWTETHWDREKELPGWLARGPRRFQHEPQTQWPSDVPYKRRRELNRALNFFLDEQPAEFLVAVAELDKLPERTGLWIHGLADLTAQRFGPAERAFTRLLEIEPEFRPPQVFRGMARQGLRDREGALADFAAAETGASQYPHLYAGRALVYLFERDLDSAFAALADATSKGIDGPILEGLRGWVHRARRGPQWTERFEHETAHFVVLSDHGKKLCFDVAAALESERKRYAQAFGDVPADSTKSHVYVFAGRDGYLDYAGDLAMDLSWTSGVYIPVLRELLIWVPIDRNDLEHTVRHEGFHQYLHHFVEGAPLWFNEGWAENFGRTRGDERRNDRALWNVYVRSLTPLSELLSMERAEFLARAELHYPQSDDVVRFLRETTDADLKPLLPAYFAALQEGLSLTEAYDRVFAPEIEKLQKAFDAYMGAGG